MTLCCLRNSADYDIMDLLDNIFFIKQKGNTMGYSTEEQELFLHYDAADKEWRIETNVWNMIKKYKPMLKPETIIEEVEDGRTISIRGVLDTDRFKVSVSKRPPKRELTEEQRVALQARMAKMHAARGKSKDGGEE